MEYAPSADDRIAFSANIYQISPENLGRLVHVLTTNCEKCLKQEGEDELEINVDAIDTVTFWELDRFLRKCLPDANVEDGGNGGTKKRKKPSSESSKSESKSAPSSSKKKPAA